MPIIQSFEKHKFVKRGEGIADVINSVSNFVSNNKDTISDTAKAATSVANATSNISNTVKRANELKELQLIREQHNKKIEENAKKKELPDSVKEKLAGSGFKKLEI